MNRFASLLLACLAVLAVGCGGGDNNGGGSSKPSSAPSSSGDGGAGGTVIKMQNIAFNPKEQTVKVGEKVTWENDDSVDHNVVARKGAKFSSENFGQGATYSFTPKQAGKIEYTCTLHPGMDGELTVTG